MHADVQNFFIDRAAVAREQGGSDAAREATPTREIALSDWLEPGMVDGGVLDVHAMRSAPSNIPVDHVVIVDARSHRPELIEAAYTDGESRLIVRVTQLEAQHEGQVDGGSSQFGFLELVAIGFAHHVGPAVHIHPLVVAVKHVVVKGYFGADSQAQRAVLAAEAGIPVQSDVDVARAFGA